MVVQGLAPDISQLLLPRINTAAHPPGPELQMANYMFLLNQTTRPQKSLPPVVSAFTMALNATPSHWLLERHE